VRLNRFRLQSCERVKRDEARQRFLATTPGERVENALRLSGLAAEMRSGLRRTR
jgi:hypothetical protein